MLIYRRAHIVSCARHAGAVLPIVAGVAALVFLSRILADAQGFPPNAAAKLLGLTLLRYAPQFLTVALAAGVALAVARAFNEMEMDAWFALGVGLRHFILPTLMFAAPVAAVVAVLSLGGAPWAARAGDDFRAALGRAIAPENLRSDVFGRAHGGKHAYFIHSENGQIRRVFLARRQNGLHEIILSGGIRRADDGGIRLEAGRLYRVPDALISAGRKNESASDRFYFAPLDRMAFDELEIVPPPAAPGRRRARVRAWESLSWSKPDERAEMVWRVNMPLAALLLAFLAPLLARPAARARAGRGQGFVAALLMFALHLNLLYFARDVVADESVPGWLGIVFPHLAASGAALALGFPALMRR